MNPTFSGVSSRCDGTRNARSPASTERSATRATRFADRTDMNVAPASTSVPPAVASDEIVTQSAIDDRVELDLDERAVRDEPADEIRRVRGIDSGEGLGGRAPRLTPVALGRQQQARAHDSFAARAELFGRGERATDRDLRLRVRV